MKRVVRKKAFKLSPAEQALPVAGVVLLFLALSSLQEPRNMTVKPMVINISPVDQAPSVGRWQEHKGWWGGYWWGSKPFVWRGRDWGPGRSAYPWYWEYDNLAKELKLAELAKDGRWSTIETAINKKINELRTEIRDTRNKLAKRRLERAIERLEYYVYNARLYKNTPLQRVPRYS